MAIDLHKRMHTIITMQKCFVDWNSKLICGTSAQILPSPSSDEIGDDELDIRYIQFNATGHTFSANSKKRNQEGWVLTSKLKLITVSRSELCNLDSASVMQFPSGRKIVDFINTQYPPDEKEDIPNIVARILDVVQNSTPLVPNDFIDVQRSHALEIMHQVDDPATKAYLDYHFGTKSGTCSICLDEFEVGRKSCRLPCLHVFHGPCIFQWLDKNPRCPICSYSLQSNHAPWFNA